MEAIDQRKRLVTKVQNVSKILFGRQITGQIKL